MGAGVLMAVFGAILTFAVRVDAPGVDLQVERAAGWGADPVNGQCLPVVGSHDLAVGRFRGDGE